MAAREMSPHEIRVFDAVRRKRAWMTARQIADAAGVAERTARHHASRLAALGVFEVAEVFPANQYRFARERSAAAEKYVQRIGQARSVFGIES